MNKEIWMSKRIGHHNDLWLKTLKLTDDRHAQTFGKDFRRSVLKTMCNLMPLLGNTHKLEKPES